MMKLWKIWFQNFNDIAVQQKYEKRKFFPTESKVEITKTSIILLLKDQTQGRHASKQPSG